VKPWLRRSLIALILLLPLGVGGGLAYQKAGEDALLARATAQVNRGELGAALDTLHPLPYRRFLSSEGRRRGAELFFRLGDDGVAHTLLQGQRFDAKDPEDQRLRDLTGRCLRASQALKKADASHNPTERVRILQPALLELPEAPALLQRVTLEELAAIAASPSEAEAAKRTDHYLQDYQELRRKAPRMADEVKAHAEQLLAGTE
jgi:hypothetical protein